MAARLPFLSEAELPARECPALVDKSQSGLDVQEQSPAYKSLMDAGLIVHRYRLNTIDDLDVVRPNSTMCKNTLKRGAAYVGGFFAGGVVFDCIVRQFSVKAGHIRCGTHKDGSYLFFGAGVHSINSAFLSVENLDRRISDEKVEHGNRAIVTVPQGFVGLAFDRGQPILLSPGMHQWTSDTLRLQELIDLSEAVIRIGPFTLLTVDEGYAAVTQDNGKQKVLPGGCTHMLTHRNWKFEKFISLKIHTDDLGPIDATTADNVVLQTTATVNWRVEDPALAARMAAETMPGQGSQNVGNLRCPGSNPTLKNDVLKQAVASLAAAMGSIRYADEVHVSASAQVTQINGAAAAAPTRQPSTQEDAPGPSQIFSVNQMTTAVRHANEICQQYGVAIVSINVISACPRDSKLTEALSAGAVASAGAQQAEIAARGNAKARLLQAQGEAEAVRIAASAAADAERVRAQGKKEAAKHLEESGVATDLAKLEATGGVISDKATFFFGATPQSLPALLSNPKMLPAAPVA